MDENGDSPGAEADDEGALHVATEGESWRFSLEDLEKGAAEQETITPGSPEAEHVAFVLLGAAVTLAVVAQFLL